MGHRSTSSRRRRKHKVHNRQDRISQLPDELIIQILSMMEMKEAVKTGTLSKRWKDLWTRVDNIVFPYPFEGKQGMQFQNPKFVRYYSFVDLTIMRCTGPKIASFYLHFQRYRGDGDFNKLFHKWIAHVIEKKVDSITLICNIFYKKFTYVPDCLYQSSSLTELILENLRIDVVSSDSSPVNWNNLKRLVLRNMVIDDGHIDNILVGSPLLQTIALHSVCGINNMNIMSTSVEKLVLLDCDAYADNIMKIKAPGIHELEIHGTFLMTKCQLLNVSSLVKATLDLSSLYNAKLDPGEAEGVDSDEEEVYESNMKILMVAKLLQSVSHVQELIIGREPIQVLSYLKLLGRSSPMFERCKHVSITSPLRKLDFPGIVRVLENGPNMETLFVKVLYSEYDGCLPQAAAECFKVGEPVTLSMEPNGNMAHLKSVKIHYSPEYTAFKCFDYEIAEYILKGAVVLEKLVLSSSTRTSCRSKIENLSKKVSTFLNTNRGENWKLKQINDEMFEFIFPKSI